MFGRSFFRDFENDPFFNTGRGMEDPFSDMEKRFMNTNKYFNDLHQQMQENFFLSRLPAIEGTENSRPKNSKRSELVQADSYKHQKENSKALESVQPRRGFDFGFGSLMGGMHHMMEDMHNRMYDIQQQAEQPNFDGQFYSSSTIQSYKSNGKDSKPEIYQAHSSTRIGQGGLRETRRAVEDSRSGDKRMEVGRYLGDRAHIMERKYNQNTGEKQEDHNYRGIKESEEAKFDSEWQEQASAIGKKWNRNKDADVCQLKDDNRHKNRKLMLKERAEDI